MAVSGEPNGRPLRAGAPVIDMSIAVSAAFAILAALMHRMRTGKGSFIDASLLDQAIFMQAPQFTWAAMDGIDPPRVGNQSPLALISVLETSDGYIMVSIPSTKFWRLLATVLGQPELTRTRGFARMHSGCKTRRRETKVANLPFQLSCASVEIERTPLTMGRDTDAVLQELGYSDTEIAQLRSDSVITPMPPNEE
jgi:crotonobetainyl-CoA:carnitine CoA-transferase CaiB-like acyl-CoA transferase